MIRAAAMASLVALSACQPDETISGVTTADDVWVLTAIDGRDVAARTTLSFPAKGRIAGQAPCNRYSAEQTAPLPWFEPGPIAATRRACPDLALEQRYLNTLAAMTLAERSGDTLLLTGDTKSLTYRRAP